MRTRPHHATQDAHAQGWAGGPHRDPVIEAVHIVARVAAILGDVHAAGFVHDDLKRDQVAVMVEAEEVEVTLLDFGLATPSRDG